MVKNLKRTLAFMLAVIMICSSTFTAYAEDGGSVTASEATTSVQAEETATEAAPAKDEKTEAVTEAVKEEKTAEATTKEEKKEEATEAKESEAPEKATEAQEAVSAAITAQPTDVTVYEGEDAVFTLEANAAVKSCQWQMSRNEGRTWSNLNRKQYGSSETLTITTTRKLDGRLFRCVVTFKDKKKVTSDAAKLTVNEIPTYPAVDFDPLEVEDTDIVVEVNAPAGALPKNSRVFAKSVELNAVQDVVDATKGVDGTVVAAVDITFKDANDNVIEPKAEINVKMTSKEIAKVDDPTVVHVDVKAEDIKDTDKEAEKVEATSDNDTVEFASDKFSVYAIVDSGSTATGDYRRTYEFQNADGTPYEFKNTAGDTVTSQIIKDGEVLQNVGIPVIAGDEIFNGWYVWNGSAYGEQIAFDTPIAVTATETVIVRANVGTVGYLTFYEDAEGTIILTKKQVVVNSTYDISQQTLPSPEAGLVFVGWSETPGENDDDRQAITNTTITVTGDHSYYPIFKKAHWLTFVSSQTGAGAKYVASQYVLYGESTVQPADPTWTGYEFDYWSTTPHVYEGTGDDTVITNDGSAGRFTFGGQLTEDTTLYAYWKDAPTNYTIVYWKQNVTDSKTATDEQKTYSYFTMETATGTAHQTATIPTSATTKATTDPSNFKGFKYNATKSDTEITVDAKGASIMNVYYDRETVTMQFYANGTSAPNNGYNWNQWDASSYVTTYTGLYGQTLAQNNYSWPQGVWTYYITGSSTNIMSYLGQFVLPDNVRDTNGLLFRAYRSSTSPNQYAEMYLEDTSGNYVLDATGNMRNVGTFNFSEKYDGFNVTQYRRFYYNNNGSKVYVDQNWVTTSNNSSVSLSSNRYYSLEIRYTRKTFKLHYLDSVDNSTVLASVSVKYGYSLASYKPSEDQTPTSSHDGKEFDGKWYADQACSREFDFANSTMPNGDVNVYAGWEDIWYWIKVDPNGGVINAQTGGATWFWETYGELVEEYGFIERNYIEDDAGTYYYTYDEFNEQNPNGTQPATRYADYTTSGSGQKYKYQDDAYALIGWYNVDKNDTSKVTTPYNFNAGVTDNVYIRAMWRRIGEYRIIYDPVDGTNEPVDGSRYADASDTAILGNPTAPEGYVFTGWEYKGEVYTAGDIIQVDASLANENHEITVTAVYTKYEDQPVGVTHIYWYGNKYDIAGRTIDGIDSATQYSKKADDVPYNTKVDIPAISELNAGTAYDGYTFLGWARKAVNDTTEPIFTENDLFLKYDNGKYYAKDDKGDWVEAVGVGADENSPYHDLYAVWQTEFYVYHSGVDGGKLETVIMNKKTMPDGTFNLTKAVTDTVDGETKTVYSGITPNTLYGGYYLKGGFTPAPVSGKGYEAYDGDNWTWTKPETDTKGTEIVPTPGETYYVKEVPADKFLKPYMHYTYKLEEMTLTKLWLITDIDDCYYQEAGFVITTNEKAKVCKSLKITNTNGGASVTLRASNVFAADGATDKDYLAYFVAADVLTSGTDVAIKQYWKTPDNVTVTGTTERIISFGEYEDKPLADQLTCSDSPVSSIIN